MNRLILAFCLLPLMSTAQTTYPSGVTGLIARYDFNGPANSIPDVSGNNHPVTAIRNVTSAAGFRNRASNAMSFNGVNSEARANASTQFDLTQVSIVTLIRFNGFYSGNCQGNAVVNRSNNYYTTGTWGMNISDNSYDGGDCQNFDPAHQQLEFVGSAPVPHFIPPGNYLSLSDWYLLVTTYDGSDVKQYQVMMDPANKLSSITSTGSYTLGLTLGTNNDSLYIGRLSHPQFPYWLNADIDEIAIFNKDLTAADVYSIYSHLWGVGVGVAQQHGLDQASASVIGNSLHVKNAVAGKPLSVTLLDMAGRSIAKQIVRDGAGTIDVGGFASGMYLVRLECEGAVVTRKVNKI